MMTTENMKELFKSGAKDELLMDILEDRKKLALSGVTEVESFEEDCIELKTSRGNLSVRGSNLKMETGCKYNSCFWHNPKMKNNCTKHSTLRDNSVPIPAPKSPSFGIPSFPKMKM